MSSKLNLLIDLKIYDGQNLNASNTSSLKNIAWQGFDIKESFVKETIIEANTVKTIFSEYSDIPVDSTNVVSMPNTEKITIESEQDKQYIILSKKILPKSLILSVDRVLAFANQDFEIEVLDSGTKITWTNEFAQGGTQAIEIGEEINVFYNYSDNLSASVLNSGVFSEPVPGDDFYRLIYLESDSQCKIVINGIIEGDMYPVIINGIKKPAYFLKSARINEVGIVNPNDEDIEIYLMLTK